jgi:excisionase family DNA binding protein
MRANYLPQKQQGSPKPTAPWLYWGYGRLQHKYLEDRLIPTAASKASTPEAKPPEYLTIADLAALMRVSKDTAYTWANTGRVPASRVGGVWRVRRSDLEALFDR